MLNRDNLKAKYGDEEVLVVPLSLIKELGLDDNRYLKMEMQGGIKGLINVLASKSYYIPRWKSDSNPEEVEIISYISFGMDKKAYFVYKRIKNGDSRGNGALSMGIGGHINPIDSKGNPIIESAIREIGEETGFKITEDLLQPRAFIRCKDSDYDLDHLGIHFQMPRYMMDVAEKDKMLAVGTLTVKALKDLFYDDLENWSKIIIDDIMGV